jgi:hypothetical protein
LKVEVTLLHLNSRAQVSDSLKIAHRPQDAEVIKADFERGHRNGLDIELIPKEAGQPLQPALEADGHSSGDGMAQKISDERGKFE